MTIQDHRDQVIILVLTPLFSLERRTRNVIRNGWLARTLHREFTEDEALPHDKRKGLDLKRRLHIPLHDRPASPPDLNPITNRWRISEQKIKHYEAFLDKEDAIKRRVPVRVGSVIT